MSRRSGEQKREEKAKKKLLINYTELRFSWQKIESELNDIKSERGRIENCFYVFHCATSKYGKKRGGDAY
jgi:hypothetical protein